MNCPNCGTELRKDVGFCLCGQRLGAPPAASRPTSAKAPALDVPGNTPMPRVTRHDDGASPVVSRSSTNPVPRSALTKTEARIPSASKPATQQDRPAEIWRRLLAKVIDSSVLALLLAMAFSALGEEQALDYLSLFSQVESGEEFSFENAALPSIALALILFWLPLWILSAVCVSVFAGTPGKLIMGFRQVRTDGRNLDFRHALLREVMVYIIGLGFGLPIWGILTLIASRAYFIGFGVTPWDHLLGVRLVRR